MEGHTASVPVNELDQETALRLFRGYKDKITVEFPSIINGNSYQLTPGNFIGQMPLDKTTVVRIRPKIPVSNIFRMLEYAYDLRSFSLLEGRISAEAIDDVFERLALILARMVIDRARNGLYQGYIERRDCLPYLRGRPSISESVRKGPGARLELECEYEENTIDLDENQILAWTLYVIPRLYPLREGVRKEVRQAYNAIAGSIQLRPVAVTECIGRFYSQLNYDYRPMHNICRFFLEHTGPSLLEGKYEFLPFLVNMPNLFQAFVSEWLRRNAPPGVLFKPNHSVIFDTVGFFNFKIDIMMMDSEGRVLAVLDTKYKNNERPSSDDIHQMISYCTMVKSPRSFLIYPEPGPAYHIPISGVIDIYTTFFDIGMDPEYSGRRLLEELMAQIK